jgi:protein-tyrosine phosphatase
MIRNVELNNTNTGKLYLHSMPGRYEDINDFMDEIRQCNITTIICLTGKDEIKQKSPQYHEFLEKEDKGINIRTFPIEDYGIPTNREEYICFVRTIAEIFQNNENILVHCAAGIGRTGLFAISLLIILGFERDDANIIIRNASSGPETNEQQALIDYISNNSNR